MDRRVLRVLVVLTSAAASACLFTDATVALSPAPTTSLSSRGGEVMVAPVVDRAPTAGRVGVKKTGLGIRSATVRSSQAVSTWFTQRLRNELGAAGLTVLETEERAPRVEVTVIDFFAEPEVGMTFVLHALVHAEVVVQLPDGRRYARRFAQRRQTSVLTLPEESYVELFDTVVRAWMALAVPAIVELIESGSAANAGEIEWRG